MGLQIPLVQPNHCVTGPDMDWEQRCHYRFLSKRAAVEMLQI